MTPFLSFCSSVDSPQCKKLQTLSCAYRPRWAAAAPHPVLHCTCTGPGYRKYIQPFLMNETNQNWFFVTELFPGMFSPLDILQVTVSPGWSTSSNNIYDDESFQGFGIKLYKCSCIPLWKREVSLKDALCKHWTKFTKESSLTQGLQRKETVAGCLLCGNTMLCRKRMAKLRCKQTVVWEQKQILHLTCRCSLYPGSYRVDSSVL